MSTALPENWEFLRKAFGDLEEQSALIARCSGGWQELDALLSEIHDTLEKRDSEIADKEVKFEARMTELQSALDKRESVIESREQASLARVQEQKDAAIAAILEQKRKWMEERQLPQSEGASKLDPDSTGSKPKQNNSKVQDDEPGQANSASAKKKVTSTSSQNKEEHVKPDDVVGSSEEGKKAATNTKMEEGDGKQVFADDNADDIEDGPEAMEVCDEDGSDDDEKEGSHKKVQSLETAINIWPELTTRCEKMDAAGLLSFLTSQRKHKALTLKELPTALKSASDPSQLVLKAIKDYWSSESGFEGIRAKKLAGRRACNTLLESLANFLDGEGKTGSGVPDEVKEEAKNVAMLWKPKLNPRESDLLMQLESLCFLLFAIAFGLASNFSEDELLDLLFPLCFRKKLPKLLRRLGLAHKASDLVDRLIKDGKQVDAAYFIQEYQLSEKFPPIPLLKAYLNDTKKGHTSSNTAEDKEELHVKELLASRVVLTFVEKYKLEDYPVEGLKRRIVQLEKTSKEKNRNSDTNTSGPKKARGDGSGGPNRSSERYGGRRMGGRTSEWPYGGGGRGGYPYPAERAGYPSSNSHGNYHYGGGASSYQWPYLR